MWFLDVDQILQFPGPDPVLWGGYDSLTFGWTTLSARLASSLETFKMVWVLEFGVSVNIYQRNRSANIGRKNTKHVILWGKCFTHIKACIKPEYIFKMKPIYYSLSDH